RYLHLIQPIKDLLYPTLEEVKRTNKRKKLIPEPNGSFIRVKCASCDAQTVCYSHTQIKRLCGECNASIWYPTGGAGKLAEQCAWAKIRRTI
ncbi:Ribosomal protein S27, partial [Trachipleistophora hominis]